MTQARDRCSWDPVSGVRWWWWCLPSLQGALRQHSVMWALILQPVDAPFLAQGPEQCLVRGLWRGEVPWEPCKMFLLRSKQALWELGHRWRASDFISEGQQEEVLGLPLCPSGHLRGKARPG